MESRPRRLTISAPGALLALVLVHAALALWLSQTRLVDGDEGFYAAAAQLTAAGRTPYVDYFYPQAPLLPYLLAPACRLGLDSLALLRLVPVLFSTLMLWLWGAALLALLPARPVAVVTALAVLALNPHLLGWHATIKTYAAADLFATAAVAAAALARRRGQAGWTVAAGVAAGLATATRAMYAPLVPLVIAWPLLGRRATALTALGAGVGLSPALLLLARDPGAFWFGNVGCHLVRWSPLRAAGVAPSVWRRLAAPLKVFGQTCGENPWLLLTLLGATAGAWLWWRRRRDPARPGEDGDLTGLALAALGLLLVVSLLPDPVHAQYFTAPLAPLAAPAMAVAFDAAGRRRPRAVAAAVGGAAIVLFSWTLFVKRAEQPVDPVWRLDAIETVAEGVRRHSAPDDLVLAFWPGYVFESGRRYLPGFENHFAVGLSDRLSAAQRERHHIAGYERITLALRERQPRLVIVGAWMSDLNQALSNAQTKLVMDALLQNYSVIEDYGDALILAPMPVDD